LAAVAAIDAGSVVGFGHSMGGAALLLAEATRPGTLRGAYVYEPIVMPPMPDGMRAPGASPLAAMSRRRRATFPSRADALMRYATRPTLNVLRADALAAYVEHGFEDTPDGTVRLRCDPEDEAKTFEGANVSVEDVREVSVPVTVAMGERDLESAPAAFAPAVAAALVEAELLSYRHLGHFGPLQDPDTVTEDVLARF
jgi:pimeloyl-ACP methyl ester carboxylesterase